MDKQYFSDEEFSSIRESIEAYSKTRDELMNTSRGLLKDAKHAIYLVHEGKVVQAQEVVQALEEKHTTIQQEMTVLTPEDIGPYRDALEEYVEAKSFVRFATGKTLPTLATLPCEAETYLCGLCDFTGELVRRATFLAMDNNREGVQAIRDIIAQLQGQLVTFHLRNSLLRKKYDSLKYNLQKVEQVLYDLHIHDKT